MIGYLRTRVRARKQPIIELYFMHICVISDQSWGRLHANVIDYNYNYFEIS